MQVQETGTNKGDIQFQINYGSQKNKDVSGHSGFRKRCIIKK